MPDDSGYNVQFNSPLERRLRELACGENAADQFPSFGGNRFDVYKQVKQRLYTKYYRDVDAGLTADSAFSGDEPAAFTHHDVGHVDDVIAKMGQLLGEGSEAKSPAVGDLNPYSVYALLVAALIHDVGNVSGREGHAPRARKVLADVAEDVMTPQEIKLIGDIAQAHGGRRRDNNKDTISALTEKSGFDTVRILPRRLAAVLRLADELAENPMRASNRPSNGSAFANLYCKRISTQIDYHPGRIALDFILHDEEMTLHGTDENGNSMYFVDYIRHRVVKTELERRYCDRFLRGFAGYDELRVTISFFKDYDECLEQVHFILAEKGFPDPDRPVLTEDRLCGAAIAARYSELGGGDGESV